MWANDAGAELSLLDDRSDPSRSAEIHEHLRDRCVTVIGPYGSDSTRAVADVSLGSIIWNHGAAADDVQRRPGVVSLPTPASEYLVALGHAVANRHAGASVVVGHASGLFATTAADNFARTSQALGLELLGSHPIDQIEDVAEELQPDSVLLCGSLRQEAGVLARLEVALPEVLLGGVSPGIAEFASVAGTTLDGALAPVQWHPDAVRRVTLGPPIAHLARRSAAGQALDYVGVQAYAAAIIATECTKRRPLDPASAAQDLRATTLYGDFGLEAETGLQRAHSLAVIQRRGDERRLVLANAGRGFLPA